MVMFGPWAFPDLLETSGALQPRHPHPLDPPPVTFFLQWGPLLHGLQPPMCSGNSAAPQLLANIVGHKGTMNTMGCSWIFASASSRSSATRACLFLRESRLGSSLDLWMENRKDFSTLCFGCTSQKKWGCTTQYSCGYQAHTKSPHFLDHHSLTCP